MGDFSPEDLPSEGFCPSPSSHLFGRLIVVPMTHTNLKHTLFF